MTNTYINCSNNLPAKYSAPVFRAKPQTQSETQTNKTNNENVDKFVKKIENMPPYAAGLLNAITWFGLGFGTDRLIGKLFKSLKTDLKFSLILNGALGVIMGIVAFYKANKKDSQ